MLVFLIALQALALNVAKVDHLTHATLRVVEVGYVSSDCRIALVAPSMADVIIREVPVAQADIRVMRTAPNQADLRVTRVFESSQADVKVAGTMDLILAAAACEGYAP